MVMVWGRRGEAGVQTEETGEGSLTRTEIVVVVVGDVGTVVVVVVVESTNFGAPNIVVAADAAVVGSSVAGSVAVAVAVGGSVAGDGSVAGSVADVDGGIVALGDIVALVVLVVDTVADTAAVVAGAVAVVVVETVVGTVVAGDGSVVPDAVQAVADTGAFPATETEGHTLAAPATALRRGTPGYGNLMTVPCCCCACASSTAWRT